MRPEFTENKNKKKTQTHLKKTNKHGSMQQMKSPIQNIQNMHDDFSINMKDNE